MVQHRIVSHCIKIDDVHSVSSVTKTLPQIQRDLIPFNSIHHDSSVETGKHMFVETIQIHYSVKLALNKFQCGDECMHVNKFDVEIC